MGCNCGKKSQDFKNIVQQAKSTTVSIPAPLPLPTVPSNPPTLQPPPVPRAVSRAERIRLRNEGFARRAMKREARIRARQEAALRLQGAQKKA